jgi:hypothetical protein
VLDPKSSTVKDGVQESLVVRILYKNKEQYELHIPDI